MNKLNFKPRDFFVDTLYDMAGSILYALSLYTFALNANFATGGVSGISIIIHHFTKWPLGITGLLLNVPLIIICTRILGFTFTLRSLWTMLINTLFLDVVFPYFPQYNGSPLIAAMFTGVLMGAGLALIYMRGSSTGGVDFITLSIKKMRPHFSMGQIGMAVDLVVILLGGLVFKNVDAVLYGIICTFGATITMDNILYGAGSNKLAIIVTDFGKQIADAISDEVGRGATLLDAKGAYTGSGRDMLVCACSKREVHKVRTTARAIDPGSMVMICEASEVFGEGFRPPKLPGNDDPKPIKRQDNSDEK